MATDTQVKDITVTLPEILAEKLNAVVKYKYKDRIALHGVMSVEKEMTFLRSEVLTDLITARYDALAKQMSERKDKDASAYFRLLVSKGVEVGAAYKQVYG